MPKSEQKFNNVKFTFDFVIPCQKMHPKIGLEDLYDKIFTFN